FNFLLPIEYSKPPPFLPVIVHHKIQYLQYFPLGNLGRNILPLDQGFKNRQAQTKQSPSSFIEII
ncbi:hypothetical protein, partial [Streptococcus pneumoniae]|uniref:hypothetical protein n=1 Tax=Streptococcus pneumoniae TaxID=1313 RepID=UPI001D050B20